MEVVKEINRYYCYKYSSYVSSHQELEEPCFNRTSSVLHAPTASLDHGSSTASGDRSDSNTKWNGSGSTSDSSDGTQMVNRVRVIHENSGDDDAETAKDPECSGKGSAISSI